MLIGDRGHGQNFGAQGRVAQRIMPLLHLADVVELAQGVDADGDIGHDVQPITGDFSARA